MGIYYLALPIGTALGFIIAGRVCSHWGWHPVFLVVGIPGLLAALAGLLILDPGRGASEGRKYTDKTDRPRFRDYAELFKSRTFVFNTAGMAAATFATGAYAAWGSTFYQRVRGMSMKDANDSIGILLAIAGLVGIALSTFVADFLRKYTRAPICFWPAWSCSRRFPWVSPASSIRRVLPRSDCCSRHRY